MTRVWLERFGIVLAAFGLVFGLTAFCFDPFTFRGDGPVYYLPMTASVARSILHGDLPLVLWQLGAGFTPFESAQVGLGYPIFLLATLVSDLAGKPLSVLVTSSALHLALAGLFVRELAPPAVDARSRVVGALLALVQPAPLLLGMQWHVSISGYPWQVALFVLLWLRDLRSRAVRIGVPLASTLLFWAAHPQVFIWTWFLLGLSTLALRRPDRKALKVSLIPLLASLLPVLAPLAWLHRASGEASRAWLEPRMDASFLIRHAQTMLDFVPGLFLGNLAGPQELRAWGLDPAGGAGIFFCPLAAGAIWFAIRRRLLAVLALLVFVLVLLAPFGITEFRWLAVGPFARFRWTWRLTMLVLPTLAVAVALGGVPDPKGDARASPSRLRFGAALLALVAGLAVVVRGTSFDLARAWWPVRKAGIEGIVAETRRFAEMLTPPARVALLGRTPLLTRLGEDPLPLAYLGLTGNLPLLVPGVETAHLYEPLESEAAAVKHLRLGPPWRITLPKTLYENNAVGGPPQLEAIGVTAIVALDPKLLPQDGRTREYTGKDGGKLWVRELAPSPPYPLRGPGERHPGGTLVVAKKDDIRPTRPLVFSERDGKVVATAPIPWAYVAFGGLGVAAALALLVYDGRRLARRAL